MPKLTEKQFQKDFVAYLKQNKWKVWEQVRDHTGKNKADVIGFRDDVGCFIGFELKVYSGIITYTKALKQIIRYQRTNFKTNPELWCLVSQNEPESKRPVRFLWRFGVGVCWFPERSPRITYINALPKDTLYLDTHGRYDYHFNTPENTARLSEKINLEYVV